MTLRLRGLGRNEVHQALKKYVKSSRTVTDVYNEFVSQANREGVSYAAEEFGVSETVEQLEEIGQICRRNKMNPTEVIELEKDIKKFQELEKKHGKSFQDLYGEYEDIASKLPEMREEKKNLTNEIETLRAERDRQQRQSGVTESQLEAYSKTKNFLTSIGIDLSDLERTKDVFINLKKEKFDSRRIVSKLNKSQDLERSILDGSNALVDLETKIEDSQENLEKVNKELEAKGALREQVRKIEEIGLSPDVFDRIRKSIVKVSKKRGISTTRATKQFEEEIAKLYDPLLALRNQLEHLEEEKRKLEEERSYTKVAWKREEQEHGNRLKDLNDKYGARKEAIDAYSSLRSKGVDDDALLRWDRILSDSKLDPRVLEAELRKTSDLKHVYEDIQTDIQRLESEQQKLLQSVKELHTNIQELTSTKNELNSSLQLTKDNLKAPLEELAKTATAEINKNAQNAKDLVEDAKKIITQLDDKVTELSKATKTELNQAVDELKNSVSDTKKEITGLLEEAETAGERIGKLEPIVRVYELLSSGSGTEEEVIPVVLGVLYNLKQWCNYKNHPLDMQIDVLIDGLKELE